MRVRRALVAAVVMVSIMTACGDDTKVGEDGNGSSNSDDTIKVGFVGALTGDLAAYGVSMREGFDLAIEEVNAGDGVDIEAKVIDDKGDPTLTVSATQRLIDDGYKIIVGSTTSGQTIPMAEVCERRKVVCFTPGATHPDITAASEFMFRAISTTPKEMEVLMNYAQDLGDITRAAILYDNSPYGKAGEEAVVASWADVSGGEVVANEAYTGGDRDFNGQLAKITGQNPDILFIPGYYTEGGLIIRQARDLGYEGLIAGPSGMYSPELIDVAGGSAEGIVVSTDFFPSESSSEAIQAFIDKVTEKYGEAPDENTALAYDTVLMIAEALNAVEDPGDAVAVRDALAGIEDFDGVTGEDQSFDSPNHDVRKTLLLITVKNGDYVELS